ncbi:MAG: hypothetical protein AAFR67_06415 [Chloroflexota bacterium]
MLLLTACGSLVPATTPPQLEHTPGVPISITDERITTPGFTVDYPDGWRVIKTSIAEAPLEFVFASPDGEMIITLSTTGCPDQQATPMPEGIANCVGDIYLVGQSERDNMAQLRDIVDEVVASIIVLDVE